MSEMELKKSHTFVKIVTHRNKPEVFSKKLEGNQPIQSVACMWKISQLSVNGPMKGTIKTVEKIDLMHMYCEWF